MKNWLLGVLLALSGCFLLSTIKLPSQVLNRKHLCHALNIKIAIFSIVFDRKLLLLKIGDIPLSIVPYTYYGLVVLFITCFNMLQYVKFSVKIYSLYSSPHIIYNVNKYKLRLPLSLNLNEWFSLHSQKHPNS